MKTSIRTLTKHVTTVVALIAAFALAALLSFGMAPAEQAYAAPSKTQVFKTSTTPKVGTTFKVDGNTYKVTERYKNASDPGEVQLVKYESSKTNPTINTVKYEGKLYEIETIGKGAFSTANGKKITSVKLGKNVDSIGANAFSGCTKLATIDIAQSDVIEIDYSRRTKSYYVDEIDIGARAFANAGTKNVTVKCGNSNKGYQNAVKKALGNKGLHAKAKVVR